MHRDQLTNGFSLFDSYCSNFQQPKQLFHYPRYLIIAIMSNVVQNYKSGFYRVWSTPNTKILGILNTMYKSLVKIITFLKNNEILK